MRYFPNYKYYGIGKLPVEQEVELEQVLDKTNKVLFQFSGGQDSQKAIEIILPYLKYFDIPYEAIFVDTKAEFPSVIEYVKEYTNRKSIPLKILFWKDAKAEMLRKGKFPHPIYKDCIHTFINYPVNKYSRQELALVVTGHNSKQRQGKSTVKFIKSVDANRVKTINPLYVTDINLKNKWLGYAQGFLRTSCFCCPFQKEQQWETMKKIYPKLWEEMAQMVKNLNVIALDDRPSEGVCVNNMLPYWTKKYGIPLNKSYKR